MKKRAQLSVGRQALQALREAVAEAIEDHRRHGVPIAVWRNGRVVSIPANKIPPLAAKKAAH